MKKDRYAKLNAIIKKDKELGLSQAEKDKIAEKLRKEKEEQNYKKLQEIKNHMLSLVLKDDEDYEDNEEDNSTHIVNKKKTFKYISKETIESLSFSKDKVWNNRYLYAVDEFKKKNRQKIKGLPPSDPNYTETHHIIPRCMGGTNDPDNLVEVTRTEHALLHALLCRTYIYYDKLYIAIMKILYSKNEHEDELFYENYNPELRKEKMEDVINLFVENKTIDTHIYYIH